MILFELLVCFETVVVKLSCEKMGFDWNMMTSQLFNPFPVRFQQKTGWILTPTWHTLVPPKNPAQEPGGISGLFGHGNFWVDLAAGFGVCVFVGGWNVWKMYRGYLPLGIRLLTKNWEWFLWNLKDLCVWFFGDWRPQNISWGYDDWCLGARWFNHQLDDPSTGLESAQIGYFLQDSTQITHRSG